MKNYKHCVATAATLIITASVLVHAQKPTFGLQAGATLANITAKYGGEKESLDSKTGFTAGFLANFDISRNFAVQPSLNFTQKGAMESGDEGKYTTTLNYLEIPVNFLYKTTDAGKGHFFVGGGPALGFALSGKDKVEIDGVGSEEYPLEIGSTNDDDLKVVDFGVNIMAGYQLANGFFLSANYTPGILNVVPGLDGVDDESSVKNSYFGIRLGYMFGGKKAGANK